MLIVSRLMGSRPRVVILTARRAVFICGETEVTVPWRIVPRRYQLLIWRSHQQTARNNGPFLSSTVTVSFAHFMRNLSG